MPPGGQPSTGGQVNTMAGQHAALAEPGSGGLRVLARLLGVLVLLTSLVLPFVLIGSGAEAALDELEAVCAADQAACLTGDVVTSWLLTPILAAAVAFSAAIGAIVDARTRPLIGLLLALVGAGALVIGAGS
ncbi:hypothetical protein Bcav_1372 [Beutenbergia cavernae DSM 12333]|uniref:Uncharacterized protein n=2 Tax=Beutenbergia TaxID=84756 RepID=C5C2E5_BEUC1|nr:hypothetical protein Bcav_1372 [Beutenbergia cavernae DSM 12333]